MRTISLIGMFRTGTNYARSLLELNYDVQVVYNTFGWKHGPLPTFNKESAFNYPDVPCVCVVKDPLATVVSWWKYIERTGKNIKTQASSFSEFIKSPVIFYDEWNEKSPEYWFSNPFDMWNSMVWNHTSYMDKSSGVVVRYEDLIATPEAECERISRIIGVEKRGNTFVNVNKKVKNMSYSSCREGVESYVSNQSFQDLGYFKEKGYLNEYSRSDFQYARASLNGELVERLGYTDSLESRGRENVNSTAIYTMCSDSRLYDLASLLQSCSGFGYDLFVIPYDENIELTSKLCKLYGATVIDVDPFWDDFGKKFFSESEHGSRGVKAWRYFRKFNAISHARGDFVFVDANVVFFSDVIPKLSRHDCDIVFGHRSSPGRNFKPWGKYFLSHLDKDVKDGFGADFWHVKKGALSKSFFEEIFCYPGFKNFVAKSPEQSFLSLVVSLKRLRFFLLEDVVEGGCYFISTRVEKYVKRKEGGFYYKGKKIVVAKWTDDYHNKNIPFNHKDMHRPFANKVLEDVSDDKDLSHELLDFYSDICGHAGMR